jgi:hypothetical protein
VRQKGLVPNEGQFVPQIGTRFFVILLRVSQFCTIKYKAVEVPITREEFAEQTKMLRRLVDIHMGLNKSLEQKELWDDNDLMNYFRISISTVKRRRKDHTFKAIRIGGRYYYEKKDLLNLRDHFLK